MGRYDDDLRRALRLLEAAIAQHEQRMEGSAGSCGAAPAAYAEMRHSLELMRQEAQRLRQLLDEA